MSADATASLALEPPTAAAGRRRRLALVLPTVVELLCMVAAIATLLPLFNRIGELGPGRDQRFLDRGIVVADLAEPMLAELCSTAADSAPSIVGTALCTGARPGSTRASATATDAVLARAIGRASLAFALPVREAERRIDALRRRAQDGAAELRSDGDAMAAIEAEIAPFVARYRLSDDRDTGPVPLRCSARWLAATAAAPPTGEDPTERIARADFVLLLGAALDGRAATAALAADARLPRASVPGCPGAAETLASTAALMADARQAAANANKNLAMQILLRSAGVQWATAMVIGYGFMRWSRRTPRPALGIAAGLAVWAVAAWLARVPWPFGGGRDFLPGRLDAIYTNAPAPFVLSMLGVAAVMAIDSLAGGRRARAPLPEPPQTMSSRFGYAGLVAATGIGSLVLFDLSLNGHAVNRYLALYHQGHLWLAMTVLTVFLFLRQSLGRALAWLLSVVGEAARRGAGSAGASAAVALVLATLAGVLAFAFALSNMRQLTSELGRVWLIVGASWFFFLRAGPLTERLARSGPAGLSFLRYAWPLLFVVAVLVGAMVATRDMGPLLIAGYASGAFVAAAAAMWWHVRSGRSLSALALAMLLFAAWIGAVTWALFQAGSYDGVTATRLESLAAPFASINDQLALVSWFQRAAPVDGFGLGTTPWCGFSPTLSCGGVPSQIQSDYTFTALTGVFGPAVAWAVSVGAAIWLHRLIRHHGRLTRGEPRLRVSAGRFVNDGQGLLSWVAVAWVVLTSCQLAVTVAGNLAVLPLTGVTFPFVSFGMTSLLVNMTFLALCLNVDLPARSRHD